jgi:mevalonate kinase
MKSIRYSAPGKVIISGEHAVVYGKPALVCAIDKRLNITFTPSDKTQYNDDIFPHLERSVVDYLESKKVPYKNNPYTYTVTSNIPVGRGLGSSAAYCACISAGLLELFTGKEWSKEEVNMCAYKMEKYFHKNSSGVDTSTSVMGGLLFYRKEFEFLKTISSLSIKLPKKFVDNLVLIDTGKPKESTGEMVSKVGKLYNTRTGTTETVLNEIEKTTKRIIVAIMKEDDRFFIDSLSKNEILLEKLKVVSPSTKKLIRSLADKGVGKVTGAGGYYNASGYILFYCNDKKKLGLTHEPFIPSYSGLVKEL